LKAWPVMRPALLIEKSVEVAVPALDEPMAKSVDAACEAKLPPVKRLRSAVGVDVPMPTLPPFIYDVPEAMRLTFSTPAFASKSCPLSLDAALPASEATLLPTDLI
jgi:hypothetical protein